MRVRAEKGLQECGLVLRKRLGLGLRRASI